LRWSRCGSGSVDRRQRGSFGGSCLPSWWLDRWCSGTPLPLDSRSIIRVSTHRGTPDWTPLSHLHLPVTHVVGGLYAMSDGVYVMTNVGSHPRGWSGGRRVPQGPLAVGGPSAIRAGPGRRRRPPVPAAAVRYSRASVNGVRSGDRACQMHRRSTRGERGLRHGRRRLPAHRITCHGLPLVHLLQPQPAGRRDRYGHYVPAAWQRPVRSPADLRRLSPARS